MISVNILGCFPLRYKSEVKTTLTQFKAYIANQFHTTVETGRSDNGGEFFNNYLSSLFLLAGIIHQTSFPHTPPKQIGVVKTKHSHLLDTTLTLLTHASMPTHFWLEALYIVVYLANRMPHPSLQFQIPYYLLFKKSPDCLTLKPFGCACFPWLKPYVPHKLAPESLCCVFLIYCTTSKGYRCYDPIGDKVYISRHVRFEESSFPHEVLFHLLFLHLLPHILSLLFLFLSLVLMI